MRLSSHFVSPLLYSTSCFPPGMALKSSSASSHLSSLHSVTSHCHMDISLHASICSIQLAQPRRASSVPAPVLASICTRLHP